MDVTNKNIDVTTMAAAAVSVSENRKEALSALNNLNNDNRNSNSSKNLDESVLDPELNQQMDDMDQMDRIEDDVVHMDSPHEIKTTNDNGEDVISLTSNNGSVNVNDEERDSARIKNVNYIANMSAIVSASQMQSQIQDNDEVNEGQIQQLKQDQKSSPSSPTLTSSRSKMNQRKVSKPTIIDSTSNVVAVAQLLKDDNITQELQSEKRAQQNRAAQRAFRQRRKTRIQQLEETERKYHEALTKIELLTERNKELERQLNGLN